MWKVIATPLVGAIIGYFTNWIAVKMLFHPRHEIRIGGWKLPFTPGVIPKGQPRLARAVGQAVQTQLLTANVMKDMLLSDEMKGRLEKNVSRWVEEKEISDASLKDTVLTLTDEESLSELSLYMQDKGSAYVIGRMKELQLTTILTQKIIFVVQEKLGDSMIGIMLGGGFLDEIGNMLQEKLEEYLDEYGHTYLSQVLAREFSALGQRKVSDGMHLLSEHGVDLVTITMEIYERIISDYIEKMMNSLNLSKVVEDRINSMAVEEVEELVLSIMKKELGTIVNLGAIIGFVLGLINVAILFL